MSEGSPLSFLSNKAIKASKSEALVILVSIPAQAVLIASRSVVIALGIAVSFSCLRIMYQSVLLSNSLASAFFLVIHTDFKPKAIVASPLESVPSISVKLLGVSASQ